MKVSILAIVLSAISVISCNSGSEGNDQTVDEKISQPAIKEESVTYTADTVTSKGYVVFDENKKGKRPAVLIVHEWWGLTDYVRERARQLADMGYIAMAVDMYGNGNTASDPKQAMALATPFYQNPQLTKTRLDAALARLKEYAQTDTANVAAIGYCYGGYVVLNAAKLGADLKGVVSFHGNLAGAPVRKDLLKAKVLICHGADDKLVSDEEISSFKKGMDSIGADSFARDSEKPSTANFVAL